jgi:hypothetical protein
MDGGQPAGGSARLFLWSFAGLLTLCLIAVHIAQRPVYRDYFHSSEAIADSRMAVFRDVDIQAAKLAHAARHPPYAAGLFGNSRSVAVSAEHVGLENGGFFNFSVPGTSFRASIAMLEAMAAADTAPRTAVISLDNLHLGYTGPVVHPRLGTRVAQLVDDLAAGIHGQAPARDVARIAWRAVRYEALRVTWAFNAAFWQQRLGWQNGPRAGAYRTDGSFRKDQQTPPAQTFERINPDLGAIIPFYMERDIRRLGELQAAHGLTVIVYESPLHPSAIPAISDRASLLPVFLAACTSAKIECYPAQAVNPMVRSALWPDSTHAPGDALGAFIKSKLPPHVHREEVGR